MEIHLIPDPVGEVDFAKLKLLLLQEVLPQEVDGALGTCKAALGAGSY